MANALKASGVARISEACTKAGIPFIHVSTDYVFDGSKPTPFSAEDPGAPPGVYRRSKLVGEQAVTANLNEHVILRRRWVISPYGRNFAKLMLRLAARRDKLNVVDDQHATLTSAWHLAEVIITILNQIANREKADIPWGSYYATGHGEPTWCGLAREIFEVTDRLGGRSAIANAITTPDYPKPASRRKNSRLACDKIDWAFGIVLPH